MNVEEVKIWKRAAMIHSKTPFWHSRGDNEDSWQPGGLKERRDLS
jgi:hypothetical protein